MQALSKEEIIINNLSKSTDTILLINLLKLISSNKSSEIPIVIDCANAGTTLRFLSPYLCITEGKWFLTGSERMKQRPISELVDALKCLGADISYKGEGKFLPLQISGNKVQTNYVEIDASISSQFVSALLMIAPVIDGGLELVMLNKIVSSPYIMMTIELMKQCGIEIEYDKNIIKIAFQNYKAMSIAVEPDWSAASYWYEMAALSKEATIILPGLSSQSLQGDSVVAEIFTQFGITTIYDSNGVRLSKTNSKIAYFEFDFTSYPDLAQTVAVTCAALGIEAKLKGLQNLNKKEAERLNALNNEFHKIEVNSYILNENEMIIPISKINISENTVISTYNDHRMALAFAPLAIMNNSLVIENASVISKSYPDFWNHLKSVNFLIHSI